MASIKDKTLSGLVGPLIISHRYGKTYLRSKPCTVKNPRTPGQMKQRGKFKAASAFVSRNLDELIRPYWNPEARRNGMSGQNLFCKLNTHAFSEDGYPDMASLKPTAGCLGGLDSLKLEMKDENSLCFIWNNNARDKKTSGKNALKIFGISLELKVEELQCNATRQAESFLLELNTTKYNHFFLFFWNKDLEQASPAVWIEI